MPHPPADLGERPFGLIDSPWGRRSEAHMNPAMTLAFARLGHVQRWDTVVYLLAHFAGGVLGVALIARRVVRRELQLARAGLVPRQLSSGRIARALSSLS